MGNLWQKITAPFKKAGSAVKKTIGDFFAPAPDQVRARDFARELPGAAETVGKKVLEFGKDILRAGPRAAASTMLSLEGRKEAVPETTMEKFLWGDKPIKDIRSTGEETIQDFGGSQQAAKKYGLPVGIAFAALDMIPVLPEEKVGQEVTEQLVKRYGDDVAKAIIKKGGKKLAEQAINDGGEKLIENAGIKFLKSEPGVETAVKDIKSLVPALADQAGKMQITGLEQAAEQLDKTGSAIIAEDTAKNLRLVVKDEGDFIKVGMDAGTGKLLPTDIKLPEKTFKTKEEAFDFIKSLAKPADQTLFHGTSAPEFEKFGTNLAYLTKDAGEAKAFAENPILGGGRGTGVARVLEVAAPEGKIKNIDDVVQAAIENGDNLDEVIAKEATDAKKAGYDYLSFNHPSSVGDKDFEAIVAIDPSKLSVSDVNKLPQNLTSKAEEALNVINEKGEPVIKAGTETAPADLRLDQAHPAPNSPPPVIDETPLASAPASTPASALDSIDKMVGKTSTAQSVKDWFKGLPQKFTQAFSDRFAGLKNFEDNLSKMAGKAIDIESSPYVAARMYAGRTGVIESGLEDLQKILSPIRSERPDFTRFILAKRAAERAERGFTNPAAVTASDALKALAAQIDRQYLPKA